MTKLWEGLTAFKKQTNTTEAQIKLTVFPEKSFREKPMKTREEIKKEVKKFKNRCIKDQVDCLLVFVGSHGYENVILTSDYIPLNIYQDIIRPFLYSSDKPVARIFIDQSCQVDSSMNDEVNKAAKFGPKDIENGIEYLYVMSQKPPLASYRDTKVGSYFIIVLVCTLMNRSFNSDLQEMLEEVTND